jgi:hypothetical protein
VGNLLIFGEDIEAMVEISAFPDKTNGVSLPSDLLGFNG